MFTKFAKFRIENKQLTIVLILIILLSGAFSRTMIPKQYNPDIEAPAFNITIPAPGYDVDQVKELVVAPLEHKIGEIVGVDEIYGYAQEGMGSVMVAFEVGENKENATIRLHDKLITNQQESPPMVQSPIITPIDPESLPVYTLAVFSTDADTSLQQLRTATLDIIDQLKTIDDVRGFYTIGGERKRITVSVDINKARAKNIALPQIMQAIQQNNIGLDAGTVDIGSTRASVSFAGKIENKDSLSSLVVGSFEGQTVALEEVATIIQGYPQKTRSARIRHHQETNTIPQDAVFLGISKKEGTNAVAVVDAIEQKITTIQHQLPSHYQLLPVQNLGDKAQTATNMLIINLFQSILIVLLILSIVLGFRNALNVAITIPLTLSVVFLVSFVMGENINRISLFALILVLGMLVDDATVVVENINRQRQKKPHLSSIFRAIKEVELGVILSTITRLLAFGAMFFVTGMMGSYMGPIPKYAIIAMVTSTAVALSISPFLTHLFQSRGTQKSSKKNTDKTSRQHRFLRFFDRIFFFFHRTFANIGAGFEHKYRAVLHYFLNEEKTRRRKIFKWVFRILLGCFVVIPPAMLIFKMRMLPKSNQNQIFLRVDMPQDFTFSSTQEASQRLQSYLIQRYGTTGTNDYKKDLHIMQSLSTRNGQAPMPNFANIFRRSSSRVGEQYISYRINLIPQDQREITSEAFTMTIRDDVREFIQTLAPQATIRILEEPPGPPTQATFMLQVQAGQDSSYQDILQLSIRLEEKLSPVFTQQDVVDVGNSRNTYQTQYQFHFNHKKAARLGVQADTVAHTLRTIFAGVETSVYHEQEAKEPTNIFLTIDTKQKNSPDVFEHIEIPSKNGTMIPLLDVVSQVPTAYSSAQYFDNKVPTVYIFGEMGDNSVIYPAIMTFKVLLEDDFWEGKYEVIDRNLYGIDIKETATGQEYYIGFGGEWELTIDTFRDLGLAMIIAFLTIYLVMVAQFKSFKTGGVIMMAFLFGFFGVFPLFTGLYLGSNEYFSATSMIGVIALAGIVVGNSILLLEYVNILREEHGFNLKEALIEGGWVRMKPIVITSLTTILGATTILGDPVRSGLARAIIGGLFASAILTPFLLPIFLYGSLAQDSKNQK